MILSPTSHKIESAPNLLGSSEPRTTRPQGWRYFMYIRKSSEPDDRQVLSLPAQKKELLKTFADLNIIETFEESQSAKAPGRPQFDRMLKRIERGAAEGIVAWHPDRLARNSVDGGQLIYDVDLGKIKDLKFAQYTFENTPEGKWMLNIVFGQSKYQVDKLSVDVRRGIRTKLDMGWRPGVAPLGYLNSISDAIGIHTIIRDPIRFDQVRRIWDLMLTGIYTPPRILHIVNGEVGLRTVQRKKSGGKPLSRSGIYRILTNPFYYGAIEHLGLLYPGKHEPMITESEFDRVQRLLGRDGQPRPKNKMAFAYTGLFRCGECGCSITAEEKRKISTNGTLHMYTYYHCTKKREDAKCGQKCIEVKELERQIIAALKPLDVAAEFKDWALAYLDDTEQQEASENTRNAKTIHHLVELTDKQLSELLDVRLKGLISDYEFEAKRLALLREKEKLEKESTGEEGEFETAVDLSRQAVSFAHNLTARLESGSWEERKLVVEKACSNRVLIDGKVTFEPERPFTFFADSAKKAHWLGIVDDVRTFFASGSRVDGV